MRGGNCAACADATESMRTTDSRANRLFIFLAGFFLTNALIGEFVGVKIFALEATLGAPPFNWSLFGINGFVIGPLIAALFIAGWRLFRDEQGRSGGPAP